MAGSWTRDPDKMTILEWIHSPISIERFNSKRWGTPPPYKYYDSPDGQDIDKKLWLTFKWGTITGASIALVDNRLYSNPTTVFQTLNRAAYWVVPITGMFTTYAAITYASTNLRGKDDVFNSGLGGIAAGSLAGVWSKNSSVGIFSALTLCLFGMFKKYGNQIGMEMFNPLGITKGYGNHRSPFHDTSLTPIGNRGWTTGR